MPFRATGRIPSMKKTKRNNPLPQWRQRLVPLALLALLSPATLAAPDIEASLDAVANDVIHWRHDFHQHPELSNREVRTSGIVAEHLRALGFDEVHTGIAHTGVIGVLKGGRPGGVVALRADMDALPVKEQTGLSYASTATGEYRGETVPVMHACGHDAHTAMLMGVASVLASVREDIPGTISLIFQPAEEGAPAPEEGGARLMVEQGALQLAQNPTAIFGLHVWPIEAGKLSYRPLGAMAAADVLEITVKGKQTHGSSPWKGVDPITVAAQIITALQTIPSRQLDVTVAPAVLTIGVINGGLRGNIIPDQVELVGTIRNFNDDIRVQMMARIERTATRVAESAGATAEVRFADSIPVTYNDPGLVRQMLPTLQRSTTAGVEEHLPIMAYEDFSYFQREIPGMMFFLGINMEGVAAGEAPSNHSPHFIVNDAALTTGVRALSNLALDYLDTEATGQTDPGP